MTEAGGYRLFLASRSDNTSGYKGVGKLPGGKFYARYVDGDRKNVSLGTYDTAVEAAVAYAKHMAEVAVTVPVVAVAKEAAGYKLFLSSKTETGYVGVSKLPTRSAGRFWASYYDSAIANTVSLGKYDTAVEAAVAYAKHMAAEVVKGL